MDLLIFDLASMRYRWDVEHTALRMFSPLREQLALVHPPAATDDREAATLACDHALDVCRLRRSVTEADGSSGPVRVRYKVALYNPYTAKVAVGAVPRTRAFGDFRPLAVPPGGLAARLDGDGEDAVLIAGDRRLGLMSPTVAELTRELASNRQ